MDYLGSGVFSRAVQCVELSTGRMVCIKIIRNNKDFLDQSLGEIKLLRYLNENDPTDARHVLRMEDFFYYREHLFIVCELLRDNLYELYKYIDKSGWAPYFTLPRVRRRAAQNPLARAAASLSALPLRAGPTTSLADGSPPRPARAPPRAGALDHAASTHRVRLSPLDRVDSLRPQTRKYPHPFVVKVRRQVDRFRVQLVCARPTFVVCPVPLVSGARGSGGHALWPED